MTWFWSRYKRGILLIILPIVLLFVAAKIFDILLGFSDYLEGLLPNSYVRWSIVAGLVLTVPFLLGWVTGFRWFKSLLEKTLSRVPKIQWLVKAFFKTGQTSDQIKKDKVVVFEVFPNAWKIGVVIQTFDHIGRKDLNEEHCLILEGTPPLPSGPLWIKRKKDMIVISPEFDVKDWMITILSLGINFPIDEKPSNPTA